MGSCISSNVEVAKDYVEDYVVVAKDCVVVAKDYLTVKLGNNQSQKYTPVKHDADKNAAAVGVEIIDDEDEIENIFNEI